MIGPHKIVNGEVVLLTAEEIAEMEAIKESVALAKAADYKLHRSMSYPSIQEQLDMQYWDSVNGTTTWADAIAAVKAEYPKP